MRILFFMLLSCYYSLLIFYPLWRCVILVLSLVYSQVIGRVSLVNLLLSCARCPQVISSMKESHPSSVCLAAFISGAELAVAPPVREMVGNCSSRQT